MSRSSGAGLLAQMDRAGRLLENTLLIVVLATMVGVAFLQIVLREVFSTGVIWANELVRILVLWLAIIGAVAAARDNRHIRIDLVSHLLSERAVAGIRVVVDLFAAAVSGAMAWYLWRYVQYEAEFEITVLGDVSAFAAHIIAPVGFSLICYRFLILVAQQVARVLRTPTDETPS